MDKEYVKILNEVLLHHRETKEVRNAIKKLLAEREEYKKRMAELKKENERLKAKIDIENWQEKTVYESLKEKYIPKQKVKEILIEIQEEYNKLDKEIDKQIKDKNKDYYKCKENIAIMQTLAYCRDKFEGLLEDK